ncbi:MAG: isoleucine--tRNA ligase, partial [Proteobacteria bacterium]|nr:isoleucine--tRNA ligase [Pseudomonadota bacterium]
MSNDYKSTVFLPKTEFPMKAGLAAREPELLARWAKLDLFTRLREAGKGREKFVLHDGPPYANGHLHIGHALNKILKDVICRAAQMQGMDATFVPGWDCHGLPIEWKIEEKYRAAGKDKDDVPILQFRAECRAFAQHWINVQSEEFQRLGVLGDWAHPYTTMTNAAEARIVRELGKFLMNGALYRGSKPVLWSVVEKTALAEAEVEYHDHVSATAFVRFPVVRSANAALEGADVVIWTTTPWTIPGNRAIAYGEAIDYGLYRVDTVADGALVRPGDRLLVATLCAERARAAGKVQDWTLEKTLPGRAFEGVVCHHPLRASGYAFDVPMLAGDFVETESGTGFVHIAPGHGTDDWELGMRHGVPVPETVDGDGRFVPAVPLFAGEHVFKANPKVAAALQAAGGLFASGTLTHSYPHSWRSKAPLIFRNTPQWFISMETTGLRTAALKAIDETRFVPEAGRNRLRGMIETRPDWCISRQRTWGVPIAVFLNTKTGEPLRDAAVMERIAKAFDTHGADAWFDGDPRRFLAPEHDQAAFEPVMDIVDVWFESGTTHAFVLEERADLKWPASLYLEGSDQHRGWFHSSLLVSCMLNGAPPYKALLTHGFTVDGDGRKMSKSTGNTVSPQKISGTLGADVLRLWVASTDYSGELSISPEILKRVVEAYRRIRNTLRFLLANTSDFDVARDAVPVAEMLEIDRYALTLAARLNAEVGDDYARYQFHLVVQKLQTFCSEDLGAFYLDILKDRLYTCGADSRARRSAQTALWHLTQALTRLMAPVLSFTSEEVWGIVSGKADESVFFQTWH